MEQQHNMYKNVKNEVKVVWREHSYDIDMTLMLSICSLLLAHPGEPQIVLLFLFYSMQQQKVIRGFLFILSTPDVLILHNKDTTLLLLLHCFQ